MILSPSISECPFLMIMWIHESEDVNIHLSVVELKICSQSVARYVQNWMYWGTILFPR